MFSSLAEIANVRKESGKFVITDTVEQLVGLVMVYTELNL